MAELRRNLTLAEEIARRNESCLEAWRDKRLAGIISYGDAWTPVWRERLDRWFADERDLAQRWLFKRRCARRAARQPAHRDWPLLAKLYRS
jgi:hypothetical protein